MKRYPLRKEIPARPQSLNVSLGRQAFHSDVDVRTLMPRALPGQGAEKHSPLDTETGP